MKCPGYVGRRRINPAEGRACGCRRATPTLLSSRQIRQLSSKFVCIRLIGRARFPDQAGTIPIDALKNRDGCTHAVMLYLPIDICDIIGEALSIDREDPVLLLPD